MQTDVQSVTEDAMTLSPAKSKRRSSFVRGRKSVCKLIPEVDCNNGFLPKDLFEHVEDRCVRLVLQALEKSLEKFAEEFLDVEELQQFNVRLMDAVTTKLTEWRAAQTASLKPNPVNVKIDRQLHELPLYIDKLKREENRWDELLKSREELAEKARRLAETVADTPIVTRPTFLKPRDVKLIDSIPDYDDMHADIQRLHGLNTLTCECLLKSVARVARVQNRAESVHRNQLLQLHVESFSMEGTNVTDVLCKMAESNDEIDI